MVRRGQTILHRAASTRRPVPLGRDLVRCGRAPGHGVGLAPQEGPHLNPRWDDTFTEGDFFTVEPGLYHEELRLGIRLEQNYLVTSEGVTLWTDWPLEL